MIHRKLIFKQKILNLVIILVALAALASLKLYYKKKGIAINNF